MNDEASDSREGGRGALAEFKEAISGLVEQVAAMVPTKGWLGDEFPRYELEIEDDGFTLWVDLPGMQQDDVDVSVAGRTVSISGERPGEDTPEGARSLRQERPSGEFDLKVDLPDDVDPLAVVARLEDGVLRVSLPKYGEARGRNIEVEKSGSATKGRKPRSTAKSKTKATARPTKDAVAQEPGGEAPAESDEAQSEENPEAE